MRKMNPEWKAKWVEALRSGEYVQGGEQLRYDGDAGPEYCCLGVLAHITGAKYDARGDALPREIARCVGLPQYCPGDSDRAWERSRNVQVRLARMNDDGKLFSEIADWIEEHL